MASAPPMAGADRVKRSCSGIMDQAANDRPTVLRSDAAIHLAERASRVISCDAASGYLGVGVRVAAADAFELTLIHADCARSVAIGQFDAVDIVAVWRSFGLECGLPLLLEHADGTLEAPYPQLGRLQLGAIGIRRRHALLAGRRPRFLARRKPARLPARPIVWRGREIFGAERS